MTAPLPKPSLLDQLAAQGDKHIKSLANEEDTHFETELAMFISKLRDGLIPRTALAAAISIFQNPTQPNATGTSPAALEAGKSPENELSAMQMLVNSDKLSEGQKRALQRVLAHSNDKEFLAVESDGTPTGLIDLRKKVGDLAGETLSLEKKLADAATELADSKKTPPDTMLTSTVHSAGEDINTILEKGKTKVGIIYNESYVLGKDDYVALVKIVESLRATPAPKPKPAPPKK